MPYSTYQIGEMVANAANTNGINPNIAVEQIRQESGFNPNATGPQTQYGTAKGLAQFIDGTWRTYGHGSPYEPNAAIAAYIAYMHKLLSQFGGRYDLALAAYNWGENRDAIKAAYKTGKSILDYSIPAQTRNYVQSILQRAGYSITEARNSSIVGGTANDTTATDNSNDSSSSGLTPSPDEPAAESDGIFYALAIAGVIALLL